MPAWPLTDGNGWEKVYRDDAEHGTSLGPSGGMGTFMSGRGAALAVSVSFALVASLLVAPSSLVVAAPPDPASGRLAFTDAQDSIQEVPLDLSEDESGDRYLYASSGGARLETDGRHSGEARADVSYFSQYSGNYAFVSTGDPSSSPPAAAEDPDGEVWYRYRASDGSVQHVQVTDDDSLQSHPEVWVESTDCYYSSARVDVAFASDRSGTWDIWVATLVAEPTSVGTGICEPFTVTGLYQVTDDPGDDLWPAWLWDGPSETRQIAFSSTRSDQRGDLYAVEVQPGVLEEGTAPADLPLTQLTSGPEADSHPAPRPVPSLSQPCPGDPESGEPRWLAFTRASDDDPRGSLAVLDAQDPGGGVLSLGVPASSEPAWSPDGEFLSYRSTAGDPDGDVLVGRFVRTCPPDLAIESVTVSPSSVEVDDVVEVRVRVVNLSSAPASGSVTIDFSALLVPPSAPADCDGQQTCRLPVRELLGGQTQDFVWGLPTPPPAPPSDDPLGDPLVAAFEGSDEVTAQVAVAGSIPDANPGNDSGSARIDVGPQIDIGIFSDPIEGIPGVRAFPDPVDFPTTSDEVTVRITAINPDPTRSVEAAVVVSSDSDLLTSGGSREAEAVATLSPNGLTDVDFLFTAVSPPAGTTQTVTLTAQVAALPPVIDPNPDNNSGVGTVTLRFLIAPGSAASGSLRLQDAFLRAGPPVLASAVGGAAGAGSRPAAAGAVRVALLPQDVPPPDKDPVDDSVSLESVTSLASRYGVSESHPTFVLRSDEQLALLYTWRPDGSGVGDVLSSDGSDRRLLADGASGSEIGHPSYSPDGRFVAYHRFTCDRELVVAPGCARLGSDIVVANADGSDPAVIYPADAPRPEGVQDLRPAWSPDGAALAFTRIAPPASEGGRPPAAIWVARGLDLAADPVDLVADTVAQLTTPNAAVVEELEIDEFDDEAAWSPDGATIAFTRARFDTAVFDGEPQPMEPGAYDTDIWLIDVASAVEQPLLAVEVGAPEDDGDCPESREVDRSGTVCRGGDDRGADWSPDGTTLVYEHTGWLYLADPDAGTDLGPVTGPRSLDPADDRPVYPDDPPAPDLPPGDPSAAFFPQLEWAQDPSWSPNGDRIAFAGQPRGQPDQRGIYWLALPADADAREIREIAQQRQPEIEPDWQPTADLAIALSAAPSAILTGQGSILSAVISNEGPASAIAASVSVAFPAGLTPGSLPAGCVAGAPVVCSLGDLPDGGTAVLDFPVVGTVTGTLTATATTSSRTVDPDLADNTATTTVTVTPPGVATADVSITLVAVPTTVQVGDGSVLTATVTNRGPSTAQATTVTLAFPLGLTPGALPTGCTAGAPVTCAVGDLPAGGVATLDFPVVGASPGTLATLATTTSLTADPDSTNNSASATIIVGAEADVSVELDLSPNPGYVGGSVEVTVTTRNSGPTDSTVTLVLSVPEDAGPPVGEDCVSAGGCDLGQIAPGTDVVRTIELTPEVALRGPVRAEVTGSETDPDLANNEDRVRLRVLQPTLLLLPPLGPPGFVTRAVGEDFPPGGRVALTWDPGLNASDDTLKVADDGTFETPVVVLTRDQLGPRKITATRTRGLEFSPVEVEFLVVPRSQAPPDFVGRG